MRVYVCIALVMSLVSVALPSDNSGDVFYEEVPPHHEGYVIENIGPCRSGEPGQYILRDEEAFAYNRTMREWYIKHHEKRSKPKKVRHLEFPVIANPTR